MRANVPEQLFGGMRVIHPDVQKCRAVKPVEGEEEEEETSKGKKKKR